MDEMETVGLGQLAEQIRDLATRAKAAAFTIDLPPESLPPGMLVPTPKALAIRDGDGKIEVKPLAGFLDGLLGKPARRKGTATAKTLASFCDLVNRGGDDATVIFVDPDWRAPKITAVLNYHREAVHDADIHPEAAPDGDDPLARFGDHRVHYAFPLSDPWKAWVAQNGKPMSSVEFAAFLEDRIAEIAVPDSDPDGGERIWEQRFRTRLADPNELIDLARDLEIVETARIKTRNRLESGETSIVFETEHRDMAGQPVKIPGLFVISLPIFFRGLPQRVIVRLRYRPHGEKGVIWFYEIHRPDEAVDERVQADVREVVHQTGRLVVDGAPEA